jgi:hypothetical protein
MFREATERRAPDGPRGQSEWWQPKCTQEPTSYEYEGALQCRESLVTFQKKFDDRKLQCACPYEKVTTATY